MDSTFIESKNKIDKRINYILDNEIDKFKDNKYIKDSILELKRLSEGGKRVRGYLVKLGQLLFGKDDESYLDLAAALEIFQTAILIHDDIIDEADKRRGMDTINNKYKGHFGISKGICVGDLGIFISYDIINNIDIDSKLKNEILKIYSRTLYNTINGEIIDVELPLESLDYHKNMNEKIIYDIYINKTAWYTIIGPMLIGSISAGMKDRDKQKLIEIGINLGIAFQIKDDLLGLYSDANKLGKTINDIKENKQTIIYKYAIDHASNQELKFIKENYGNSSITDNNTIKLLGMFEKIGAKKNAESLVEEYTKKSISIVNGMDLKNKDKFISFIKFLLKRKN